MKALRHCAYKKLSNIGYRRSKKTRKKTKEMLTFEGCNFFRQRLVLSTLSGKAVKIVRIRDKDEQPGLTGLYTSSFVHVCHSSHACAFVITIILNNE